jgi:PPM family protein phosphatase
VLQSIASVEEEDTLTDPRSVVFPFAYGETDTGRVREANEDAFAVVEHLGLFMVADGMGGAAGGEIASRMVIEQVERAVQDREATLPADTLVSGPESGPGQLVTGIRRANREIHQRSCEDPEMRGMGTTFAGLLLLSRGAVIAHVGDSRVYRLRDGQLVQMTRDHSLANHLVERGVLKTEAVSSFRLRNVITRAVGVRESVEVDARLVDVRRGDAFLLCSDGLHGELGDDEIAAILREPGHPAAAVGLLIDRANEKGGADNITAVLVRLP